MEKILTAAVLMMMAACSAPDPREWGLPLDVDTTATVVEDEIVLK